MTTIGEMSKVVYSLTEFMSFELDYSKTMEHVAHLRTDEEIEENLESAKNQFHWEFDGSEIAKVKGDWKTYMETAFEMSRIVSNFYVSNWKWCGVQSDEMTTLLKHVGEIESMLPDEIMDPVREARIQVLKDQHPEMYAALGE
jgi:hypothetical protein